ncbi:DUF6233 domain-containing protein [Streptomyces sp. NPDC007162]|uniref:DUF6233 domain-containing protein n=1 Tax=Streptomyces sp. NPDC007162 TaxID=3156917 RepID=UPI00340DE83F
MGEGEGGGGPAVAFHPPHGHGPGGRDGAGDGPGGPGAGPARRGLGDDLPVGDEVLLRLGHLGGASVHYRGDCWAPAKNGRCRPVTREQALDALRHDVPACPHCEPAVKLGFLERPATGPQAEVSFAGVATDHLRAATMPGCGGELRLSVGPRRSRHVDFAWPGRS